ncbi:hypothetical protein [Plantactinospora soyae]|uniref:Uncharacterized protein n=1 Tax=Plantactinospora soyae TaxID=1544732 RepID=A0A927R9Y1_9ACTN|nr:hypothetical protein [Plantactinospora soyae]MBE1491864.1 hypothetical protein [Plantactinospora soyae]
MDAARRRQFAHLGDAKKELLAWTTANAIPLVRVEFVVPFVETDFDASVWLFYDTDASAELCARTGVTADVEQKFMSILSDDGYPAGWLAETSFQVDSHENVERNFEGSYFYRLR